MRFVLIGGGGHAKVTAEAMLLSGLEVYAIADDNSCLAESLGVVAWTDEEVLEQSREEFGLVIGVGDPSRRSLSYRRYCASGFSFVSIIHPSAVIAAGVEIADGAQVMAGAVVQPGVRIGRGVLVNTRAVIDHDCEVGDFSHIAPGAVLCGGVSIGTLTHVGASASVLQQLRIGDRCLIGAGAVVTKSVPDGVRAIGVPARFSLENSHN